MCNAYDIGSKLRPGHRAHWEKRARERLDALPKTGTVRKTDPGLVVRKTAPGDMEPAIMRWGFSRTFNPCINNTRADKLAGGKSMWSAAWEGKRRCVIAVEAFYEWSGPKGKKQAHRIRATDIGPDDWMWMAGLWEEPASNQLGPCYSMITTGANRQMEPLHDRMPVILPFERIGEYLDSDNPIGLLVPYAGALDTPACESPLRAKSL